MNYKFSVAVMLVLVLLLPVLVIVPEDVRAETGTVVGTGTNNAPLYFSFQGKGPFYAEGRYWVFFYDGTNYVWQSSTDLVTWADKQTVYASTVANSIAVCYDGTYFHFARATGSSDLIYFRGVPVDDGSMSFGGSRVVVDGSTNFCAAPSVAVSDGHVFIGYRQTIGANSYPYVVKNNDATSADTWTTAANFPAQLSTTTGMWAIQVLPSTSGGVFCLYVMASATPKLKTCSSTGSIGSEESAGLGNIASFYAFGATSDAGALHFAYVKVTSNDLVYRKRTVAGSWDESETTIQASTAATLVPGITVDWNSHDLIVSWQNFPTTNHVYYKKFSGGSWGQVVDWIDETGDAGLNVAHLVAPLNTQNSKLLVVYKTKAGSPYNVKIASLSLATAPVAAFTANVTEAYIDQNIQFTDQSTNTPTAWAWNFGDGSGGSSSQNPIHAFAEAGTFTITLNASNSAGYDVEQKVAYITIYDVPTAAAGVECIEWSRHYHFTDESEGQGIINWTWVFSDGTIAYTQDVEHTFEDYDNWANLTVSNPSGSSYNNASFYVILHFTTTPDESISVGEYYNYFPQTNYGTDANLTWSYETLELEDYANGTGFGGRPGISEIVVSIRAEYQGSRIEYQNYTLSVNTEGLLTDSSLMTIVMFVVGLIVSFIIAYVGMSSGKPFITLVAALFAFVVIAALWADETAQAYWWLVMVPIVEFLMFGVSMKR